MVVEEEEVAHLLVATGGGGAQCSGAVAAAIVTVAAVSLSSSVYQRLRRFGSPWAAAVRYEEESGRWWRSLRSVVAYVGSKHKEPKKT